jgi:CheY-like chemotaxis protein
MRTECDNGTGHTVLVVADDFRILLLAQAVLAGKGYRVLVASSASNAVELLARNEAPIHSIAIRAGIDGHEEVRSRALRRGAKPWTFRGVADDRSVRLEGIDSGPDWESAASPIANRAHA